MIFYLFLNLVLIRNNFIKLICIIENRVFVKLTPKRPLTPQNMQWYEWYKWYGEG